MYAVYQACIHLWLLQLLLLPEVSEILRNKTYKQHKEKHNPHRTKYKTMGLH